LTSRPPDNETGNSEVEIKDEWFQGDKALFRFLRFVGLGPRNISFITLAIALAGGAGGAWLQYVNSPKIDAVLRTASTMTSFIIGAVIGGLAMMTRAVDTQLFRKLRKIEETPVAKFFSPFMAVILLGVTAGVFLLVVAGMPDCTPTFWKVALGGAAGFFTLWSLSGLLTALGSLTYFMDVLEEAAQMKDVSPGD
jgi:hypothetical protein